MRRFFDDEDALVEDPHGDYVHLDEVKEGFEPLINSAWILVNEGFSEVRLAGLRNALEHMEKSVCDVHTN